jgi:hypothetical protein
MMTQTKSRNITGNWIFIKTAKPVKKMQNNKNLQNQTKKGIYF